MVCDQRYMLNLAQSVYMFGMLVGAIVLGSLSDRWVSYMYCFMRVYTVNHLNMA